MRRHRIWSPLGEPEVDIEPLVDFDRSGFLAELPSQNVTGVIRRTWRRRFGTAGIVLWILGTLLVLAVCVMLSLFWWESIIATKGGSPTAAWRRIATNGWATRIITLSTMFLRAVISAQAGLFTSLIAALWLERAGVSLVDAPLVSITRATRSHPLNLLKRSLFRMSTSEVRLLQVLVILELAALLAAQLASTILVSDFNSVSVKDTASLTPLSSSYGAGMANYDYWSMPPMANWRFGEITEQFVAGDNFHDTGHTYRAFLPFVDEQQRKSLRQYYGPADVLDYRVVCVSPRLTGLTLMADTGSTFMLAGNLSITKPYPMLQNTPMSEPINFTCSMAYQDINPTPGTLATGLSSLCYVGAYSQILLEDPLVDPITTSDEDGGYELRRSQAFMIADFTYVHPIWDRLSGIGMGMEWDVPVNRTDGPWAIGIDSFGDDLLRVTACYINLGSKVMDVSMNSDSDGGEPHLLWDRKETSFDTSSVRYQLGVNLQPESPQNRGLLDLNPRSSWDESRLPEAPSGLSMIFYAQYFQDLTNAMSKHYLYTNWSKPSIGIILSNATLGAQPAHISHVSLFQDSLRITKSPALAAQALLTRICQMIYYTRVDRAPVIDHGSTTFATSVLVPVRWSGLLAVLLIIVSHLCLLAIVTGLFLLRTELSEIGNLWQTVSQIVTRDTQPILQQTTNLRDKDIRSLAASSYQELGRRNILRRQHDGSIAITPKYRGLNSQNFEQSVSASAY